MTMNLMMTSTNGNEYIEQRKYKQKQMSQEELAASHDHNM